MLEYLNKKRSKKEHESKKHHHHKEDGHHHKDDHHHHHKDHEHHHRHKEEEVVDKTHRFESPVLSAKDEQFLQYIVSEDDQGVSRTVDPLDLAEAGEAHGNDMQLVVSNKQPDLPDSDDEPQNLRIEDAPHDGALENRSRERAIEDEGGRRRLKKGDKRPSDSSNRWSFMQRFGSKKSKDHDRDSSRHGKRKEDIPPEEAAREEDDLTAVLDKLNLAADKNNRVFSLSKESRELVKKFSVILQDMVHGVPTAYDDLVKLFDSSHDQLEKSYGRMPPYLQKFIRALPKKLTTSIGPEMLASTAKNEGASSAEAGDMKHAAKKAGVRMPNLQDMVTKPGAVAGLLRAVMNFLKLRWPAFMGTSVLWSLGVFVLLLAMWYCHKRGREVRLARERAAQGSIDGGDRIQELEDDDDDDDSIEVEDITDRPDHRPMAGQPAATAPLSSGRF